MTAFSKCASCGAELGVDMEFPIYCIPCIEEIERLGMGIGKYRKHRQPKL